MELFFCEMFQKRYSHWVENSELIENRTRENSHREIGFLYNAAAVIQLCFYNIHCPLKFCGVYVKAAWSRTSTQAQPIPSPVGMDRHLYFASKDTCIHFQVRFPVRCSAGWGHAGLEAGSSRYLRLRLTDDDDIIVELAEALPRCAFVVDNILHNFCRYRIRSICRDAKLAGATILFCYYCT